MDSISVTPAPPFAVSSNSGVNAFVNPGYNSNKGDAGQGEADRKEIERLRSRHQLYEEYRLLWDKYLAAYEGGPSATKADRIHKHQREHIDDFQDRAKRLHYVNYCEPLVDFFTTFIYAETIQRDSGGASWFEDFINNVDKKGNNITACMKTVSDDKQIFGMVYALVDAPPLPRRRTTKADVLKVGWRPYVVFIRPTEILNWGVDDFDSFIYVKRQQFVDQIDESGNLTKLERYTEWTRKQIKITDIDVTEDKTPVLGSPKIVRNQLGVIPIELARFKLSKDNKWMGNSFLRDMADNNFEVMNLTSLLQEFLYRQCFNLLVQEMDGTLPPADQQDGDFGTSNVLTYPKGAREPKYIAPSATPADKIAQERQTIVAEMYRRAAQDTANELFKGGGSSGFSKAQSFRTTVPRIASRAETLEAFEMAIFRLVAKYYKQEFSGSVKYKDHYEITNLTDALAQLTTLFKDLQFPSETFAKEQMLRMVHEFDGKISPQKMVKITAEIEAMDWTEYLDTMKLAFIGRAAQSPDVGLAMDGAPVKGKDTATAASTAQKSSKSTETVKANSNKTPGTNSRKNNKE